MAELISKEKVLWCLKASSEEIDWGQSEDGDAFKHYIGAVYRTIAIIKPEHPEQKRGHWVSVPDRSPKTTTINMYSFICSCSECGKAVGHHAEYSYCPGCGAMMNEVKQ